MSLLEVRPYNEGDEANLVKLLIHSFPGWNDIADPMNYWIWKYRSWKKEPVIAVAFSDGKMVGCSHDIILNVKILNETLEVNIGDDLATHPDYRGKGVMTEIGKITNPMIIDRGIKFSYSIPISPVVLRANIKKGRQIFPHKVSHMYLLRNPKQHFQNKNIQYTQLYVLGFKIFQKIYYLKNAFAKKPSKHHKFEIIAIDKFDEKIDEFWNIMNNYLVYSLEKDRTFLNWRYCDPRSDKYEINIAEEDGKILGYIVSIIKKSGNYVELYILDSLTLPERQDVNDGLLSMVVEKAEGINAFHYLVFGGSYAAKSAEKICFLDPSLITKVWFHCDFTKLSGVYERLKVETSNKMSFGFGDYF